jgi:hypothetical protein
MSGRSGLRARLPTRTCGVAAAYRGEAREAAIAEVPVGEDDSLRLGFS